MDQFGRIPLFGTWSGLPAARGDVDLELDAANVAQCLGAFACRTNGAESKPNGQETGTESRFMDDALQHLYISFSLFLPVRPTANAHVTHVGQMQNANAKWSRHWLMIIVSLDAGGLEAGGKKPDRTR